jgi:hypothetical protein
MGIPSGLDEEPTIESMPALVLLSVGEEDQVQWRLGLDVDDQYGSEVDAEVVELPVTSVVLSRSRVNREYRVGSRHDECWLVCPDPLPLYVELHYGRPQPWFSWHTRSMPEVGGVGLSLQLSPVRSTQHSLP